VEPVEQEPEELSVDLLARIGPVHDWELPMELAILRDPDETQQGAQKAQAGHDRYTVCTDRMARREGFEPPTLRFEARGTPWCRPEGAREAFRVLQGGRLRGLVGRTVTHTPRSQKNYGSEVSCKSEI
jgi:hypothetical protein